MIIDAACDCLGVISKKSDVTAVKGNWFNYHKATGQLFLFRDTDILQETPVERVKSTMEDRDSIFYVMRHTKDLVREFDAVVQLTKRTPEVCNSYYHVEHLMAINLAASGS